MTTPLVSVIVPSFNHERFVAQAIESVFAQTYPRIELIVVDDGSSDSSPTVIERALSRRKDGLETRFFVHKNQGAHAAIGFGLLEARGELLTLLNSDDFFHPERIEVLVGAAHKGNSELFFSAVEIVSEDGAPLSASTAEVLWYHEAMSLRHSLPTLGFGLLRDNLAVTSGNLFFTRSLYEAVGPFESFKYAHDADFILRSLLLTEPQLIPRKLLSYRLHGANTIRVGGAAGAAGIGAEGREILNRYMKRAVAPGPKANRFAPCPAYWPRYFNRFINDERPFFGESRIVEYLDEEVDVGARFSAEEPVGRLRPLDPSLPARMEWGPGPKLEPTELALGEKRHPVVAAGYNGAITRVGREPNGALIVEGWAVDPVSHEPPSSVVVFCAEERIAAPCEPKLRRPPGGGPPEHSGFKLVVPAPGPASDLRVFAIFERGIALSLGPIVSNAARPAWLELQTETLTRLERTERGWKFLGEYSSHEEASAVEWVSANEGTSSAGKLGWVDHVDRDSRRWVLSGWALDQGRQKAPQAVLLCDGQSPIRWVKPNWERRDIIQGFSLPETLIAGFWIELPPERSPSSLKTYVLWEDGTATELPVHPSVYSARNCESSAFIR